MRGLVLGAATLGTGALADRYAGTLRLMAPADWAAVAFNLLALGPWLHTAVRRRLCGSLCRRRSQNLGGVLRRLAEAGEAVAVVAAHSLLYHVLHKTMHEHLFAIHAYHHTFKESVPVSAANAVTPAEFVLAYMLPFVVACAVLRPVPWSLDAGVVTVSAFNLAVHARRPTAPVQLCVWHHFVPQFLKSLRNMLWQDPAIHKPH